MRSPRLLWTFAFVGAAFACTNGNGAKPPSPSSAAADAAAAPAKPAPAPKASAVLTSFPTVDLAGLGEAERQAFQQIVNEEICPCGCPQSFAACLQEGTRCQPAVLLASWLADQLRQGMPAEALAEMITEEAGGFSSKPKEIEVAGYAAKGAQKPRYLIVEYADFECAHCRSAAPVLERLVEKYPDRVRVVFKHFPLSFHAYAKRAAAAAEAAGQQGRFWEMHDAIFATQNLLDDDLILGHAKALGLDVDRFEKDWNDPASMAKVEASRKEGEALGVQATPFVFVNGRPFQLMRTLDALELRLAMEEARASSSCQ